jgi:hypothetical protein
MELLEANAQPIGINELHVHRSSFVCAALAQLPEVEVVERRPIKLALRG